jgi:hypothetical protein
MFVEVLQGVCEGWRKGDIRELPKQLADTYIARRVVKKTNRRKESYGLDKSLAVVGRRKGKKPVTKG